MARYRVAVTEDTTPKAEEGRRRSERVLLQIPIEVKGTDAEGKPFTERTHMLVINRHGARIALKTPLRPESRITIVNRQRTMSCPFRVVGRTGKSLGRGPEWGVECLEPGVNFWGICFPETAQARSEQEAVDALVECAACHFRELAQLTLEEYRAAISQGSVQRDCPECGVVRGWGSGLWKKNQKNQSPCCQAEGRRQRLPPKDPSVVALNV